MKRLTVAILIIAVLVFSCLFSYSGLSKLTQEVAENVSMADTALRNQGAQVATHKLEQAYSLWHTRQSTLGALVRHNELDDIENLFHRALQSLADNELSEYRMHSRELQAMLKHIPEMELPTIQNIF